jgi:hypothetical protein
MGDTAEDHHSATACLAKLTFAAWERLLAG